MCFMRGGDQPREPQHDHQGDALLKVELLPSITEQNDLIGSRRDTIEKA